MSADNMAAESTTLLFNIPLDIIMKILENLDMPDVINMMLTCKTMNKMIMQDNILWKKVSRKKLIVQTNVEHKL